MSERTAAAVLAKAACFDPTLPKPDRAILAAWAESLGDIDPRLALQAVTEHYRETDRRIMPAHVLAHVDRMREAAVLQARAGVDPNAVPDADPDDVPAYLEALRAGRLVTPARTAPDRARDVQQVIAAALKGKTPREAAS